MSNGDSPHWTQVTQEELYTLFQDCYKALTDSFWAADNMEDKDYIRGIADFIFRILTQINRENIEQNTQKYSMLADDIKIITPKLEKIQKEIGDLISSVEMCVKVGKTVDSLLKFINKCFK
jgi:hypothetical protein